MQKKKIEPSEYPEILKLYKKGLTLTEISNEYHVARTTISYILKNNYNEEFNKIKLKDRVSKVELKKYTSGRIFIPKLFFQKIGIDEKSPDILIHLDENNKEIILKKPKKRKNKGV